jgi:hypothetical protein
VVIAGPCGIRTSISSESSAAKIRDIQRKWTLPFHPGRMGHGAILTLRGFCPAVAVNDFSRELSACCA